MQGLVNFELKKITSNKVNIVLALIMTGLVLCSFVPDMIKYSTTTKEGIILKDRKAVQYDKSRIGNIFNSLVSDKKIKEDVFDLAEKTQETDEEFYDIKPHMTTKDYESYFKPREEYFDWLTYSYEGSTDKSYWNISDLLVNRSILPDFYRFRDQKVNRKIMGSKVIKDNPRDVKSPKMHFVYEGESLSLPDIYKRNKKRRGRSRYLLSVRVDVVKDGKVIPAKVVYVRNKRKRKEYLCLISTDLSLTEDEIIRIYGKRWDIEVFFKVCKSYLRLSKECRCLSYDAITAHTAIVFARYMMLSIENRESRDERSLGELFLYCSDEMADITWIQAFHLIMETFRKQLSDYLELSEKQISTMMDAFMKALPPTLLRSLKAA